MRSLIVNHKLLDCNEMIVTHKLLDCNEMVAMGTDDCNSQIIVYLSKVYI